MKLNFNVHFYALAKSVINYLKNYFVTKIYFCASYLTPGFTLSSSSCQRSVSV